MSIPADIKQAATAIWIGIAVEALGAAFATRLGYLPRIEMVSSLIIYALFCIIPYKIANGSNAARYFLLVLFCVNALILWSGAMAAELHKLSTPETVAGCVDFALTLFALIRLFQPSTNKWYSAKRQRDAGTA